MKVETTTNYQAFKPIDGNRYVNQLHLKRLKKSMQENYLYTIIVVNERMEIIDGQHRFECAKELNLPLNYVVCKGYGLNEVHTLNQNSKVWSSEDYLDGYCKLGYEDYILFREFKLKYDFSQNICVILLSNGDGSEAYKQFIDGEFKIKSLKNADFTAQKLLQLGKYYAGFKRRSFVYAVMKVLKNKNFDFDTFIQKLKIQPTALKDCSNMTQYLELIENIYNFKNRNKVSLRYESN